MTSCPKTPFIRSKAHRQFVARHHCIVCNGGHPIDAGWTASQAAHVRMNNPCGTSKKPSDEHTVPLCPVHHDSQHDIGEVIFWGDHGIDPHAISRALAENSPDPKIRGAVKEVTDDN